MNMNPKTKKLLLHFGGVLLICLFAYFSVKVYKNSQQDTIDQINTRADVRQDDLRKQLDSTQQALYASQRQLSHVMGEIGVLKENMNSFRTQYDKDLQELIKSQKNEEKYINDRMLTVDEQLRYISNYIYSPYSNTSK